jgi:replicative DNA helicase
MVHDPNTSAATEVVTNASVEAERAVIGSLLIDPDAIIRLRAMLPVEAFYTARLGWIYDAILALADKGTPADFLTLTDELENRKQLEEIGGASYIMDLLDAVPTSIHVEHYARIVIRAWQKRDAVILAQRITQSAMDGTSDSLAIAAQLLTEARKKHNVVDSGPQSMATIVDATIRMAADAADRLSEGKEVVTPTPFTMLNRHLTGGMMAGDVITVIGSPGIGKSTFVHMCADYAASKGRGVLAFITEMNRFQYAARQLAPHAKVESRAIRSGAMNGDQWDRVWSAAGQVGRPNFLVDDKTFDATRFEERIGQSILMLDRIGQSLGLIVFDYLQLFKDSRRKDKRVEVGDIINGIREIANAYEVPVIVVSSLAREGYKNDAKPNLYNSKESGDIEYATTIGLAMWREANEAQITMEIQKNRDGKAWEQFKLPPMVAGAAWYDLRQQ